MISSYTNSDKQYYQNNKNKILESQRDYRERQKLILLELLGNHCIDCNSIENLEFDHIDKDTKLFDISANLTKHIDELILEAKKCQLRCYDCHSSKHNKKEVGHGEGLTGKKNCKCKLCKDKRAQYARDRYYKEQ